MQRNPLGFTMAFGPPWHGKGWRWTQPSPRAREPWSLCSGAEQHSTRGLGIHGGMHRGGSTQRRWSVGTSLWLKRDWHLEEICLSLAHKLKLVQQSFLGAFQKSICPQVIVKHSKLGPYKRNIMKLSVSKLGKSDHHVNPVSALLLCMRMLRAQPRSGILQSPSATDKSSWKEKPRA